jgi:hypothetical protein
LTDASAGRFCSFNPDERVAQCYSPIPVHARLTADDDQVKDLGTKIIEGVRVEGKRHTSHSMLGLSIEVWTSPELQIDVERHMAGYIDYLVTTTSLQLGEPPARLFEIPPDYKVSEQAVPKPPTPPAPRIEFAGEASYENSAIVHR